MLPGLGDISVEPRVSAVFIISSRSRVMELSTAFLRMWRTSDWDVSRETSRQHHGHGTLGVHHLEGNSDFSDIVFRDVMKITRCDPSPTVQLAPPDGRFVEHRVDLPHERLWMYFVAMVPTILVDLGVRCRAPCVVFCHDAALPCGNDEAHKEKWRAAPSSRCCRGVPATRGCGLNRGTL